MPQREEFFFPLQTVKQYWGREWELIATWAVGEDWQTTPFDHWPARMRERTGVQVSEEEDMPLSLDRVKHAWDHRNDPAYRKPAIAAEPPPAVEPAPSPESTPDAVVPEKKKRRKKRVGGVSQVPLFPEALE